MRKAKGKSINNRLCSKLRCLWFWGGKEKEGQGGRFEEGRGGDLTEAREGKQPKGEGVSAFYLALCSAFCRIDESFLTSFFTLSSVVLAYELT